MTHALEARFCDGDHSPTISLALKLKNIFTITGMLPENGEHAPLAREKMANASTMAGMALQTHSWALCRSMAHKLGAFHHLPHGVTNAILITDNHAL